VPIRVSRKHQQVLATTRGHVAAVAAWANVHPRLKWALIAGSLVVTASSTLLLVMLVTGPSDKAKPDFETCMRDANNGDFKSAVLACKEAVSVDPNSASGKAAADKLKDIEPRLDAEVAKAAKADAERKALKQKADAEAEKARAAAEKARWKTMPATLDKEIRNQAMWDLGRGTATPVMDVITKEIGPPVASYEGGYGTTHTHVWGARPSSTRTDDIRATPFSLMILRDLTCGDYTSSMIEFYSYGERI